MNEDITIYYATPSQCRSWGAWAWSQWDIRKGWNGPSRLIRERGFRVLGIEVSWDYVLTAD